MRGAKDFLIAFGMLVTGSINSLSTKLADRPECAAKGSADNFNVTRDFAHPFFQANGMFVGEFLCLIVFYLNLHWRRHFRSYKKNQDSLSNEKTELLHSSKTPKKFQRSAPSSNTNFNPLIFVIPACCDLTATSCMYIGLTLTKVSVFQMLRGSVVLFTGIFSVAFLRRKLWSYNWFGMFLVLAGTITVGLQSVLDGNNSNGTVTPSNGTSHNGSSFLLSNPLTGTVVEYKYAALGDLMIVAAQIIVAVQMVVEEKFVNGKNIPALLAVGWEGFWGMTIMGCLMVVFYHLPQIPHIGNTPRLEDAFDAFSQMANNELLFFAIITNVFSIAFFNFFGISITKRMSASSRMVLDSLRTIVIWAVEISLGWDKTISWLQMIGFALLVSGCFIYNDVTPRLPCFYYPTEEEKKLERKKNRLSIAVARQHSSDTPSKNGFILVDNRNGMDPTLASDDIDHLIESGVDVSDIVFAEEPSTPTPLMEDIFTPTDRKSVV